MPDIANTSRRKLIQAGGLVVVGAASWSIPARAQGIVEKAEKAVGLGEEDVTPPEDLMREHGVLDRVLLIYEAGMHKFTAKQDFDPDVLTQAANVVKDFIENYHEKSEEDFLFPRFRKAGKLVDLVDTLARQHEAGRRVTERILRYAPQSGDDEGRAQLTLAMQAFITMYRPHAAREDTVLFPALRKIVSSHEFDSIGEDMEKQEHQKFGDDGFEKMAAHVGELEQRIGIADLKQFTPSI